jgi:hypothetical protein
MDHVTCPKCGSNTHIKVSTVGVHGELCGRARKCAAAACGFEFETVEISQERFSFLNSILYHWNQMRAWALNSPS